MSHLFLGVKSSKFYSVFMNKDSVTLDKPGLCTFVKNLIGRQNVERSAKTCCLTTPSLPAKYKFGTLVFEVPHKYTTLVPTKTPNRSSYCTSRNLVTGWLLLSIKNEVVWY